MNKVLVVSGYVPLTVRHMDPDRYKRLGRELISICEDTGFPVCMFDDFPYEKCWLAKENPPMVGANPRAEDRFATDEEHARCNVVCNQFVEWAWKAYKENPKTDVIVVLVSTVMKQGAFTGCPVTAQHIQEFLRKVARYDFKDIPFPGMAEKGPIDVYGHNWRFCGSTHIWPTKWLKKIRSMYKCQVREFIDIYHRTPLDLAIWPAVEKGSGSGLPFRFYRAENDATQFTNFPGE